MNEKIEFETLLKMSQQEIVELAKSINGAHEINEGSIFVPGTAPFVLVAHMDTVYPCQPKTIIKKGDKITTKIGETAGIGGDDRCGCWCLFEAATWEYKPALLFCSDEETCAGSSVGLNEVDWSNFKCFIEVDGPGYGVYYSGEGSNTTLNNFMEEEFGLTRKTTAYNDIQELCKEGNPPGITLGGAYYEQHCSNKEWISQFGLSVTIQVIKQITNQIGKLEWSVVPEKRISNYGRNTIGGYQNYYGGAYQNYYTEPSFSKKTKEKKIKNEDEDYISKEDWESLLLQAYEEEEEEKKKERAIKFAEESNQLLWIYCPKELGSCRDCSEIDLCIEEWESVGESLFYYPEDKEKSCIPKTPTHLKSQKNNADLGKREEENKKRSKK